MRRIIRTVDKLPTFRDRPTGPSPEELTRIFAEKEREQNRRADLSLADLAANGGLLPDDLLGRFTTALAGVGRQASSLGRVLRASGFSEGGTVTGRTASREPPIAQVPRVNGLDLASEPDQAGFAYLPPARRLGLSGPEAVVHDVARFATLYGAGPQRIARNAPIQAAASDRAALGLTQSRRIEIPGTTELLQAQRLAAQARLGSELRVTQAGFDAISEQLAPRRSPSGDNVSSFHGIRIVVDPNMPDDEMRMVTPPRGDFIVGGAIDDINFRPSPPLTAREFAREYDLNFHDYMGIETPITSLEEQERPNIKNDPKQMNAPHARFLEENAQHSRRRRRK